MHKATFYALVIIGPDGEQQLGGAFPNAGAAEAKGRQSGRAYEVRPVFIG